MLDISGRIAVKLYTGPLSLFSAKVRIALAEKGVDYEHESVDWSLEHRYLPHHPDVAKLNPKAQVPVLVDGDTVVCDSTLILEYLEERYPESTLLPSALAARARCRQFEAYADEILFPRVWDLIEEVFYPPPADNDDRNEVRVGSAKDALAILYVALDAELAGRDYLCGDYTLADLSVFVMAQTAVTLGAPPDPGLGRLAAWFERTGLRPAVQRDMQAMQVYATGLMGQRSAS